MEAEKKGVSLEGLLGMALAVLGPLIDLNSPLWRILCLGFGAFFLANAVRKTRLVQEGNPSLSVIDGFSENSSRSPLREFVAVILVLVLVAAYGFLTWPAPKKETPFAMRLWPYVSDSQPLAMPNTGKKPVVPTNPVFPVQPSDGAKPPANPKPAPPKPKLDREKFKDRVSNVSDYTLRNMARGLAKDLNAK